MQSFTLSMKHTPSQTQKTLVVYGMSVSLASLPLRDAWMAEPSLIGPWLAPLCPVIIPNPLALGIVGQGSWPNPPLLLFSTLQLGHATLSPPSHPLHCHDHTCHTSHYPSFPPDQTHWSDSYLCPSVFTAIMPNIMGCDYRSDYYMKQSRLRS